MFKLKYKRFLVLKSGQAYWLRDEDKYSYNATSFADNTIRKFILRDGAELICPGNEVSHVIHKPVRRIFS